jgi:acetyl-CoA acyltransferase
VREIVIAGYARSPFQPALKGALARVRPDELAAQVVAALIERARVDPNTIEDVIVGCAFPEGEQGLNVARLIGFLAGMPERTAATTVNRFCGSSMQAVHMAAGAIAANAGEAFVCAGVESMSRVPMMGFNPMPHPGLARTYPQAYVSMGETAESLARVHQIARRDQEEFAVRSHRKAADAQAAGRLAAEIVSVRHKDDVVERDGCIRAETRVEKLAELKPAFDATGTVTAGTSSPLTDGASAVLVTSAEFARSHGLESLARVRGMAVAGCAPEIMGMGPVPAARKALDRAGLQLADVDVIELNEAFAAQALAVIRSMGMDEGRVNLDGGAIALGHPLGASGARITGKAASILRREGKALALATMCIGGGQGIATVLEAV